MLKNSIRFYLLMLWILGIYLWIEKQNMEKIANLFLALHDDELNFFLSLFASFEPIISHSKILFTTNAKKNKGEWKIAVINIYEFAIKIMRKTIRAFNLIILPILIIINWRNNKIQIQ